MEKQRQDLSILGTSSEAVANPKNTLRIQQSATASTSCAWFGAVIDVECSPKIHRQQLLLC
jgi:hypothetical protein